MILGLKLSPFFDKFESFIGPITNIFNTIVVGNIRQGLTRLVILLITAFIVLEIRAFRYKKGHINNCNKALDKTSIPYDFVVASTKLKRQGQNGYKNRMSDHFDNGYHFLLA